MNEIWRDITGYEDYQISSWGRVKSLKYGKERILKPTKDSSGYLQVGLCKNGQRKPFKVHRLVAMAFIPNPDNLPEVNHKNEIKTDNRVENLEWCTQLFNIRYGTGIKRRSEKQINGKCSKSVYQHTLNGEFVAEYPSLAEVERQLGYNHSKTTLVCNGKRKTAYGYVWRYKK